MKVATICCLLVATLTLFACGGGSGSGNGSSAIPPDMLDILPSTRTINPLLRELSYKSRDIAQAGEVIVELHGEDLSVLLQIRNADTNKAVVVTEIRNPDNTVIYSVSVDNNGNIGAVNSDFFDSLLGGEGGVAVYLPPTPEMSLTPGKYTFVFEREDNAALSRVTAFVKSNPENTDFSLIDLELDLNIWVAHEDASFNMDTFRTLVQDSYVKSINSILGPYHLALGKVNFFRATADEISQFSIVNLEREFGDACKAMLAATGNSLSLNLAFVSELTSDEGGGIGGASATPGFILDAEVSDSCFFVAQKAYVADPESGFSVEQANLMQAGNILHEASHFLSLSHTTEANGENFDKIDDTLECDVVSFDGRYNSTFDEPGIIDGYVSDHECSFEGGASNVLFYAGHPDFLPFIMTEDQAWVIRRHPLARPQD